MQGQILFRLLIAAFCLLLNLTNAQFFKASQPIENLLTRATIDKIPVGRPDPSSRHVLMELPIVKVELSDYDDEYDFTEPTLLPVEVSTERVNPYVASGILTPEQRHQRFKSLRPSYPFARRRGEGDSSDELRTSTTTEPSTTSAGPEDEGLKRGNLRSRFRFRPSILSSKRKNKETEEITTEAFSQVESSPNRSNKLSFRRSGGVSDLIRRNRPSFRRKSTTISLPQTTPVILSTASTNPSSQTPKTTLPPTTLMITVTPTTLEDIASDDFFDFETPLTTFAKKSQRTQFPLTTTPRASTINVPKTAQTTPSLSPSKQTTTKKLRNPSSLKRRRRPRPTENIVPISNEEEKELTSSSNKAQSLRFRGKRVKGRRVRGNRRKRPQKPMVEKTEQQVATPTPQPKGTKVPTTRNIRRERIPARRQNARADFEPLIFEETPRRANIVTQSSIQTERKIKLHVEEPSTVDSEIVRRDNKIRLKKTRRNRIRGNEIERYSFEDEDGSFTWGYKAEDGSFKEETRGVDCIIRGRYGYIDDSGEIRSFKYESGVPCKEEEESLSNLEARGVGYFDYSDNRFVLPDGRRVKVQINQKHRARG